MRRVARGIDGRPGSLRGALRLAALIGGLSLLLTSATAGAGSGASSSWSPTSLVWGNSLVTCNFTVERPVIAMASPADQHSGVSAAMGTMTELSPNGSGVAAASLSVPGWSVLNLTNATDFRVGYVASLPVTAAGGTGAVLGNASFRIEFALESYASSSTPDGGSVGVTVNVSNWPWSAPVDRLALTLPVWPTFADAEHLIVPPTGTSTVTSASNATGAPREYLALDASANATSASGGSAIVAAAPQMSIRPESGTVTVTFGSEAGTYRTLSYHATLGLVRTPTVAGIPLYEYALVAGASSGLSVAVGAGVRRIRRSPPSLLYAEGGP
ncbi:MAG: hypothetical protein L3J93_01205 [Thermoplasmata archaeon]|nr:hypothetical protein [Thermoplasmata archaeon]